MKAFPRQAPRAAQARLLAALVLSASLLASCAAGRPEPTATTAHVAASSTAVPLSPMPTGTPLPQPSLAVSRRWAQAAERALSGLAAHVLVVDDPAEALTSGVATHALIPGSQGYPAGSRALALAVPFDSPHADVTLAEAQASLNGGDSTIQALEWSEMRPDLRALRVDGALPNEPGYALRQPWSIVAAPGHESQAAALGEAMAPLVSRDDVVRLAAVGDVMLGRALGDQLASGEAGNPFSAVIPMLAKADITVGNLESALGEGGAPENKGYTFIAPPEAAPALAEAGFDLLSLANNHAMDYGPQTLLAGIDLLRAEGIAAVGAGQDEAAAHRPVVLEANGLTIAFLAYVDVPVEVRGFDARTWQASAARPGVAWADPKLIGRDVSAAAQRADLVVVLLHSGYEYVIKPSPVQRATAQAAIDAGAALVIGHHAHILQPIEIGGRRTIIYGLGNFAFEDAGPPESALLNVWLDSDGVRMLEFVPVLIGEDGRPAPAAGAQAAAILASLRAMTDMSPDLE